MFFNKPGFFSRQKAINDIKDLFEGDKKAMCRVQGGTRLYI